MLRATNLMRVVYLFAALFMILFHAMPAHAQSLDDQAAAAQPTTIVSYVQAPVEQHTTILPRVSFQLTGADDWHIYIDANVHAYHFDRAEAAANHYNENNWGGGFELTNDVLGIEAGYYYNSLRKDSFYFLGRYAPIQFDLTSKDRVNVGILAGILSGYEKTTTTYTNGYTVNQVPDNDGFGGTLPVLVPTMLAHQSQKPRGFMPAAGFLISYQHNDTFGLNLIFVPPVRSEGVSPFMGIQLRYGLPVKLGF